MHSIKKVSLFFFLFLTNLSVAQHSSWSSSRPDSHAPISIMGDHYHQKGEFMFSYRWMSMKMGGMQIGKENISSESVLESNMATPTKMQMNMHMLGLMYAPSNTVTLMIMSSYLLNDMGLKTKMGMKFSTSSGGFGDTRISALVKLLNKSQQSLHAMVGISFPTGNINQKDDTPMMSNAILGYPMQLGSGTLDPRFGLTYLGQYEVFSWGTQAQYIFRIGKNSKKYSLGNQFLGNIWSAFKATQSISLSARLSYLSTTSIKGSDASLNPMMMPLLNSTNSGRNLWGIGLGFNYLILNGALKNLRLALEVSNPLSQKTKGIQMKEESAITVGLQYALNHIH